MTLRQVLWYKGKKTLHGGVHSNLPYWKMKTESQNPSFWPSLNPKTKTMRGTSSILDEQKRTSCQIFITTWLYLVKERFISLTSFLVSIEIYSRHHFWQLFQVNKWRSLYHLQQFFLSLKIVSSYFRSLTPLSPSQL